MDPEMETAVEEEVAEVTPQEQVESFATDVASKATAVASGDMTPDAFVEECMATLTELQGAMTQEAPGESPLGGFGQATGGEFPLPEAEA